MPDFIEFVWLSSFLTQNVELKKLTSLLIELKWQIWNCRAALRPGFISLKGWRRLYLSMQGLWKKWWSPFQMVRQSDSKCLTFNWQRMNWHSCSPRFLVISTKALQGGEISLRSGEAPWWWEISRLSVFIEPGALCPDTDRQLRSR